MCGKTCGFEQRFFFHKAKEKKITLSSPCGHPFNAYPSKTDPSRTAFTHQKIVIVIFSRLFEIENIPHHA